MEKAANQKVRQQFSIAAQNMKELIVNVLYLLGDMDHCLGK